MMISDLGNILKKNLDQAKNEEVGIFILELGGSDMVSRGTSFSLLFGNGSSLITKKSI